MVLAFGVDALREEQVGPYVGAQLVDEENVDPDQELGHGSRDGAPVLRIGLADLDRVEEGEHVAKGEAPLVGEGGDGAAAAEAVGEEPRRVRAAGEEVIADVVGRDEVLVEGAGPEPGQAAEAGEQVDEARDGDGKHGLHRPRLQALRILPREERGFRRWHSVWLAVAGCRLSYVGNCSFVELLFFTTERSGGFRRGNAVWLAQKIPG